MTKTVILYKCDNCEKIITEPKNGLVVHGNIYVADPNERGGLIGNNFPTEPTKHGHYPKCEDQVSESAFCIPCFLNAVLPDIKLTQTRGLFDLDARSKS